MTHVRPRNLPPLIYVREIFMQQGAHRAFVHGLES